MRDEPAQGRTDRRCAREHDRPPLGLGLGDLLAQLREHRLEPVRVHQQVRAVLAGPHRLDHALLEPGVERDRAQHVVLHVHGAESRAERRAGRLDESLGVGADAARAA